MAIHLTPEEHDADPPEKWKVKRIGRRWHLCSVNDGVLGTFDTKKEAEKAKTCGFIFDLYEKEGLWFRGKPVSGWRPYSACKPQMSNQ